MEMIAAGLFFVAVILLAMLRLDIERLRKRITRLEEELAFSNQE